MAYGRQKMIPEHCGCDQECKMLTKVTTDLTDKPFADLPNILTSTLNQAKQAGCTDTESVLSCGMDFIKQQSDSDGLSTDIFTISNDES